MPAAVGINPTRFNIQDTNADPVSDHRYGKLACHVGPSGKIVNRAVVSEIRNLPVLYVWDIDAIFGRLVVGYSADTVWQNCTVRYVCRSRTAVNDILQLSPYVGSRAITV